MFAFHPDVSSHSGSTFDERRWVIHLRQSLNEEIEEDAEVPISIFSVPKTLMAADPDSYVPQEVAIGPYHCRRPELYEMERYKLAAAKRFQKSLQSFKFGHLVEQVAKYENKIRAHYHKFLNCNGETLGWMMAVDASFLLEVLQAYAAAPDDGRKTELMKIRVSSIKSHLADISSVRISTTLDNAILRDMVKLENQIPLFVLRKILELHLSSSESAHDVLTSMLIGFCKEVSPLKLQVDFPNVTTEIGAAAHLLDVLYRLLITMPRKCEAIIEENAAGGEDEAMRQINDGGGKKVLLVDGARKMIEKMLKCRLGRFIKGILFLMPWKVMTLFVPGLKLVLQPIETSYLRRFPPAGEDKEAGTLEREKKGSRNADNNNPPLAEEIAIPSVSELHKAGVTFLPMKEEGIADIYFDDKKVVLYLPCICVDLNTAVRLHICSFSNSLLHFGVFRTDSASYLKQKQKHNQFSETGHPQLLKKLILRVN
ncbi:unnamed protein product [Cuscuta europaea]|uniref:Uncharacterized protein n=1 Tax=Cuscuta europaea TaxID=41803 RepID=A0A9P1ECL7_CUSEU|nr:unnamed protein product [Cuscuta europaea]